LPQACMDQPWAWFSTLSHPSACSSPWPWSPDGGRTESGLLSFLALAAAIGVAGWWCVFSWSHGERYQGHMTTLLLALLNAVSALCLVFGFAYASRHPSLRKNIVVHWCFVVWVFGWSVPYFGELR
jgi:hypothetical protein